MCSSTVLQLRHYIPLQSHPVALVAPGVELALDPQARLARERCEQCPCHRRAPALAVTASAVVDHGKSSVTQHPLDVGEVTDDVQRRDVDEGVEGPDRVDAV